jgi:hypothetical protein
MLRYTLCPLALLLVGLPARAADTGTITGVIARPEGVTFVLAVNRAEDIDKRHKGEVDPKSGKFTIKDLPLDATYDLVINVGEVRLEGVNLAVPRSDFEEEQPLTKADREEISKVAKLLNKFENEIEILTISGNCQHAAALLNKKRTTPFFGAKDGEMIWRLELWHFQKPDETWLKDPEELGVGFYRERLQKADFEKKSLTLDPALGGIKLSKKTPTFHVEKIELPDGKPGIRLRPEKKADK